MVTVADAGLQAQEAALSQALIPDPVVAVEPEATLLLEAHL